MCPEIVFNVTDILNVAELQYLYFCIESVRKGRKEDLTDVVPNPETTAPVPAGRTKCSEAISIGATD